MKRSFAILASVPFESDIVLSSLRNVSRIDIAGKAAYKGLLRDTKVILAHTGIGKVNAAHSTTCVMENFKVQGVINMGVGGAYADSGLDIGDIAVATKEIYGDEGVAGLKDWKGMDEISIPLVIDGKKKYFNEFSLDKKFLSLVTHHPSLVTKSGVFVTVSAASGTRKRAAELGKRFNAICENMEGAAIAHVCTLYKIPMLEVRGISNMAGVRDKKKWDLRLASENCQKAVLLTYPDILNIL